MGEVVEEGQFQDRALFVGEAGKLLGDDKPLDDPLLLGWTGLLGRRWPHRSRDPILALQPPQPVDAAPTRDTTSQPPSVPKAGSNPPRPCQADTKVACVTSSASAAVGRQALAML